MRSTFSAVADAVAREEMIRKDDVARLLAAQRQAALQHLLHYVLVADRRADQIDAAIAERKFQPDVAHHRGDDRLAGQLAFLEQMIRREQQHGVAVHGLAVAIDEQRAIAVAVERHAQPRAAGDDLGLQHAPRCVDPQFRLMLRPFGWFPMRDDVEAQIARTAPGAIVAGGAVGAVDDDAAALARAGAVAGCCRRCAT